ncbi:ABC transporter permease [Streptococcus hyointestinalis]|uniref:Peptide ABC transporter permease n=1 Tax=Streptococcus hyointestinalis TaxID=1337 RepID=A0A380K528_9STRE|nr:ABC transporter permease [Streptococcus hyointestinalis]MCI6871919.1 ABC transporter permease [Streptococcus hyointestinalis]MDD6384830.1 ABC transporter permease [Streptococcus hyointestinalis]MDD7356141.1 ABC transporter permease [Streptococcus hyointestinalis]MDY4553252.1 ABC transporter permease [Streptococcus hyointestinalis]SUN60012.1 peptide ABC transporter permease [Streptococcus hyointestinalis]
MSKENTQTKTLNPTGFSVISREFLKDKVALVSLTLLVLILAFVFIGSLFIDQEKIMGVNIISKNLPPGYEGHLLGTDSYGRDVLGQLIIGARNSILIGFSITIITSVIGVSVGLISGYYGGRIDGILMRIVDFIMILPILLLIIVFVTVIKSYTIYHFILIMSAFYWTAKARLFRTRVLSEASLDYVSASKTLGTSDIVIMLREILPNISSLVIVNLTLNFAGNIGIETSLTYLGFGLPATSPSLGTLIAYARNQDILQNKAWIWLPATVFILVMMLSINYVGQAFQRVADARQRLG